MSTASVRLAQVAVAVVVVALWHVLTSPGLLPPVYFERPDQAALLFGRPSEVLHRIVDWFASGEILDHLGVTLFETLVAFALGTAAGLVVGTWLALSPRTAAVLDPYLAGLNAAPGLVLAPLFSIWLGVGVWSKVALGVILVSVIVCFNVYKGVRDVSPGVLASARMLGASRGQLLRHVYLPSAMGWVLWSLHTAVGLAFVAAVIGEYLGSASGVGYLVRQAEATSDASTVIAGILVLIGFALLLDAIARWVERRLATGPSRTAET